MALGIFNAKFTLISASSYGLQWTVDARVSDNSGFYTGRDVLVGDLVYIDSSNKPVDNAFVIRYKVRSIVTLGVTSVRVRLEYMDGGVSADPSEYLYQPGIIVRSSPNMGLGWISPTTIQDIPQYLESYSRNIDSFKQVDNFGGTGMSFSGMGPGATLTVTNDLDTFPDVSSMEFDRGSGFFVTGMGPNAIKVSLGSHFKTVVVPGATSIVASGEDTLTLAPYTGTGIYINTDPISKTAFFGVTGISGGVDMGTPSDGSYTGGLFDQWQPSYPKADAFDDITTALRYMAPADASTLQSTALSASNTTLYDGRLSAGNINYESGKGPGTSQTFYILTDATFNLTSAASPVFNKADKGNLKVYINGSLVETLNVGALFNEAYRAGTQVYTPYTSGGGYLTVLSVAWFNSFPMWQRGQARINITPGDLRQGWNAVYLLHDGSGFSQASTVYNFFYDQGTLSPTVGVPAITERSPVFKYLSGVKLYDRASTFNMGVTGARLFDNTYHSTASMVYSTTSNTMGSGSINPGDSGVTGCSNPPNISDAFMTVIGYGITTPSSNVRSSNSRLTVTAQKPWGTPATANSVSQNRLVDAYTSTSTDLIEYFDDEIYRLLPGAYGAIPGAITGQWSSSTALSNGNSEVYSGQLLYPAINFSSGYLPVQSVNYSAFSGNQVYYRALRSPSSTPKSAGVLRILSLSNVDIGQVGSGAVNVEIKLPSQTGWMDLGRDYNSGTFTGVDGDGCRTAQSSSDWSWTSGTFTTALSGYMIIIRVTFRNSTRPIDSIQETSWT